MMEWEPCITATASGRSRPWVSEMTPIITGPILNEGRGLRPIPAPTSIRLPFSRSAVRQFFGPLCGFYHRFAQRHSQFAFFEFENAVDGPAGRSAHGVFELGRVV